MFAIFLVLIAVGFGVDNKEFFDQVAIEKGMGAEWHYVGKSALDPTAKALPLQCWTAEVDKESVPCGEPYIYYKLKMPENGAD